MKFLSMFVAARLYLLIGPTALFLVGAGMNQAVVVANGGRMPVQINDRAAKYFGFESSDDMADKIHVRMSGKTRLNWLADYVNLQTVILSPGDLLIIFGQWIAGYATAIWGALLLNDFARLRKA